jgi:hypothetical protein
MKRWRSDGTGSDGSPRFVWTDTRPDHDTYEVATLLRVHRNTLHRWQRSGLGPPVLHPSGLAPRYRRDQVLTWMTRHHAQPRQEWRASEPTTDRFTPLPSNNHSRRDVDHG